MTAISDKSSDASGQAAERLPSQGGLWPLLALVAISVLFQLTLVVRLLRPFSLVRLPDPQLAPEPFVTALGADARGLASFLLTIGLLIALYCAALALVGLVPPRRLLPLAVLSDVCFALTLWPTIALGSTDLYHYILDGRALALHGGNPLAQPPEDFPNDPLTHILFYNRENTGAYGPLFYLLAALAALLGRDDLVWSTFAIKGLAVLWLLGCMPLVYLIAEQIRRGHGAAALLAFAWNPLLLFEVVGSGHNDIGVAFFGLLGFWLALSRRWPWAPVALALGVLVKPTAVLLVPALLVWLLLRPRRPRLDHLLAALAAAGLVVALFYVPFWAGQQTLSQLRHLATLRINSPADLATVLLAQRIPPEEAIQRVKIALSAAFLVAAGAALLRTRGPRAAPLLGAAFWSLFAYFMLACWWFWPWYLVPLVALGATLWPGRAATLMVVFSCTALLLYAPLGWRLLFFTYESEVSQAAGVALTGFLAPALLWMSGWWRERSAVSYQPRTGDSILSAETAPHGARQHDAVADR